MNLSFREKLNRIIFESDTKSGRFFDVLLLWLIVFSVLIVILESVEDIRLTSRKLFLVIEWILTGIFTIEYALRIFSAKKPFKYIFSFYGVVDLLAILPAYVGIVFAGAQSLLIIRAFRLLRVFRIL
ncbi:MAG: ion transporter, partial [Bacteroidales bacterium]|nr:ion transporter [Bacteroidales bacterium]